MEIINNASADRTIKVNNVVGEGVASNYITHIGETWEWEFFLIFERLQSSGEHVQGNTAQACASRTV